MHDLVLGEWCKVTLGLLACPDLVELRAKQAFNSGVSCRVALVTLENASNFSRRSSEGEPGDAQFRADDRPSGEHKGVLKFTSEGTGCVCDGHGDF